MSFREIIGVLGRPEDKVFAKNLLRISAENCYGAVMKNSS